MKTLIKTSEAANPNLSLNTVDSLKFDAIFKLIRSHHDVIIMNDYLKYSF